MTTDGPTYDPYEILGVPRTASEAQIRAAWRALLMAGAHPDTADQGDRADVAVRTHLSSELNRAYHDLSTRRKDFDRTGYAGAAASPDTPSPKSTAKPTASPSPSPSTASAATWAGADADHRHRHRERLTTFAGFVAFLRLDRLGQWIAVFGLALAGVPLGLVSGPYWVGDLIIWAGMVMALQAALAGRLHHTPLADAGRLAYACLRLAVKAGGGIATVLTALESSRGYTTASAAYPTRSDLLAAAQRQGYVVLGVGSAVPNMPMAEAMAQTRLTETAERAAGQVWRIAPQAEQGVALAFVTSPAALQAVTVFWLFTAEAARRSMSWAA